MVAANYVSNKHFGDLARLWIRCQHSSIIAHFHFTKLNGKPGRRLDSHGSEKFKGDPPRFTGILVWRFMAAPSLLIQVLIVLWNHGEDDFSNSASKTES